MANCAECVHVEVCKDYINAVLGDVDESQMCGDDCEFYKDRSRFVELPFVIGDTVYVHVHGTVEEGKVAGFFLGKCGQTLEIVVSTEPIHAAIINYDFVYRTFEEAERALKRR